MRWARAGILEDPRTVGRTAEAPRQPATPSVSPGQHRLRRLAEELNEIPEDKLIPPASGIHGHDLTLGSGSFDGIIGTGIFARWRQGFLTANVQYAIRSKGADGARRTASS